LTLTNNHDEAIKEAREAQRLDPLSSYINLSVGQAYLYAGQFDKAVEVQKMILETNQNFFPAHVNLAHAYAAKSMLNRATKEIKKAVRLSGGAPVVISALANGYLETGKEKMAEKLIDGLLKKRKNEYVPATCFLHYYMLRDNLDKAYTWLKRAIDEHDSLLPLWIINPIDKYAIPNEPRFNALLNIVGMERNINLSW
jgi:tetratricopeptide (TPR) repeat protein